MNTSPLILVIKVEMISLKNHSVTNIRQGKTYQARSSRSNIDSSNEIYRIKEKREVPNGKFGRDFILSVSNADGNSIQVWATSLIAKKQMPDGKEEMKLPCFIRSRGLKVCEGCEPLVSSFSTSVCRSDELLRTLLN